MSRRLWSKRLLRISTIALLCGCTPKDDLERLLDTVRLEVGAPGAVLGVMWEDDNPIVV